MFSMKPFTWFWRNVARVAVGLAEHPGPHKGGTEHCFQCMSSHDVGQALALRIFPHISLSCWISAGKIGMGGGFYLRLVKRIPL